MDRDSRLRSSKDAPKTETSFAGRDGDTTYSDPERRIPSYTQPSSLGSSLFDQGLRHSRATGDYYGHISPESSNDQQHGSTPSSTGNAVVVDSALGQYLNEMSMGVQSEDHDPEDPLADLKRPRACEACRQLKVRCEPDNEEPSGSCKRCAKAKRKCVITAPTRKRQKKTDSRVSELEKKIDALTASLQASRRPDVNTSSGSDKIQDQGISAAPRRWRGGGQSQPQPPADFSVSPTAGMKRNFEGDTKNPGQVSQSDSAGNLPHIGSAMNRTTEAIDVIDRGIIDFQTANDIFNHYVNEVTPTFPAVVFPANTTMDSVRYSKPILFFAIMAVSVGAFRPDLLNSLVHEVHCIIAERVVVKGEKSLELVQSIMVAVIWYSPPEQFEELKFFQLIHMAIAMAMDIGMGRVTRGKSNKQQGLLRDLMGKSQNRPSLDLDAPETRRIWLGAYFMAVNASMALRRPLLCRWLPYMDECIEILQTSPEALPSDKCLIHWATLSHIAEEIGFQFSMDDPSSHLSMSESKVQYGLKGFEKQLDEWRKGIAPSNYSTFLRHGENIVNIYMHEIAMHNDHNIDEFSPPFTTTLKSDFKFEKASAAQIDALTACLTSIHTSLECLLSIKPADMICIPTVFYARTAYAFIALLKMFSAITSDNDFGRVFSPADLKVEEYFDKMIDHLKIAAEKYRGRTASRFAMVLNLLRNWFNNRKTEQSSVRSEERASIPVKSGTAVAQAANDAVQQQTLPSDPNSTDKRVSPPTNTASNLQQWAPYDVPTSDGASSNPFFLSQQATNPATTGMMATTSQSEDGSLPPDFEFPMFDTATLFAVDMVPDELFNLPFDVNGNLYVS